MRKKILTAFTLFVLAVFGTPSFAATLTTRITLVIEESHSGSLSHEVSADYLDERGVFTGSDSETIAYTDSHGRSVTETVTEFRNVHGELLMSADVAITAASTDFTVKSGENFAQVFSVDTAIALFDSNYDEYSYTLGIDGLPEWLYAAGELLSYDVLTAGTTEHHYEFALSGTPGGSFDAAKLSFTAVVYVSGDEPVMMATASKDVTISAEIVPKSPDIVPKSDDVSPDIVPTSPDISPDIVPKSDDVSPDIVPSSPDVVPISPGNINTDDLAPIGGGTASLSDIVRNMTDEQKAAVTTLKIGSNVSDLTGLDDFKNLAQLDLTEAVQIETVNLRGNSSVKSLDIAGNTGVKSLVLASSNVETVDASGCNNLAEVDVAGCKSLVVLDVSHTQITKLDAEDCTRLEVLDCSDCQLVDLNITGCDNLNILDCSNNKLHRLDVYMFGRLRELMCYNQRITGWRIGRVFSFIERFAEVSASDYDSGVENITNLKAWDFDGASITAEYDPDTGTATFGGDPAKITYDYITGFGDVKMDVTVFAEEDSDSGIAGVPSRGGGCNAEFALSWLALGIVMTLFKRKRE